MCVCVGGGGVYGGLRGEESTIWKLGGLVCAIQNTTYQTAALSRFYFPDNINVSFVTTEQLIPYSTMLSPCK